MSPEFSKVLMESYDHEERVEAMAAPHVDVSAPLFGGSVRLSSASGGLEALWVSLRDPEGREVIFDRATQQHLSAAVRVTPSQARDLAALLTRYADSHKDSSC